MTDTAAPTLGLEPIEKAPQQADDIICQSVTSIIGALEKPALLYWSAEQAAIAAVGQQSTWRGMLEDCDTDCPHTSARDCPAVKWLRDARFRRPKDLLSSKDLGTCIHQLCEEYALTGTRPDADRIASAIRDTGGRGVKVPLEAPVLTAMLDRFDGWLQRTTPSYQATEVAVYSPTYGYAGTCDGFLSISDSVPGIDQGFRAIIDYKSSREPRDSQGKPKTPYPEVSPQLAAYRWAQMAAVWRPRRTEKFRRRVYLLSPEEQALAVPVPEVDGGLCIHITPEHCEAFPVRCDEAVHEAFLYVQEAFRWLKDLAPSVIGEPLEVTR